METLDALPVELAIPDRSINLKEIMNKLEDANTVSQESPCDCDEGYYYAPHSSGEPIQTPCPRCKPHEAKRDGERLAAAFIGIPIIMAVLTAVLWLLRSL